MIKPILFALAVLLFLSTESSLACTGFSLCLDGHLAFARNTDFGFSPVAIVRNESGVARKSYVLDAKLKSLEWISKFRSLTFNHVGIGFPNEGMNEKGLVVAPFSLVPNRKYVQRGSDSYVNEWQWIQYHLDIHATVAEVIDSLKNLSINRMVPNAIQLLVCDKHECIVIEPNENTFEVHNITEFPVIANDRYPDIMRSYREQTWNQINGAYLSGGRFLLAARAMMQRFEWPAAEGRAHAFSLLSSNVAQPFTNYQTVFEPSTGEIHVRRFHKDSSSVRIPIHGPAGSFELPEVVGTDFEPTFKQGSPVFYCEDLLRGMGTPDEKIREVKAFLEEK